MIPTALPVTLPIAPTSAPGGTAADAFAALFAAHPLLDAATVPPVDDGTVLDVVAAAAAAVAGLHAFAFGSLATTDAADTLTGDADVPVGDGQAVAAPAPEADLAATSPAGADLDAELDAALSDGTDGAVARTSGADTASDTASDAAASARATATTAPPGVGTSAASIDDAAGEAVSTVPAAEVSTDAAPSAAPRTVATPDAADPTALGASPEVADDAGSAPREPAAAPDAPRPATRPAPALPDHLADPAAVDATASAEPTGSAPESARGAAGPSALAQRLFEAIRDLRDAPPPRVVVIETGEARLRLGLGDDGVVHLRLLDTTAPDPDGLLHELDRAFRDQGLDADIDGGDRQHQPSEGDAGAGHGPAATPTSQPTTRAASGGLRL
ncbi:hypothetical protein FTX61_18260 [Nitriliruptoraceae bacterium ZYF776]|nr:hypothetical protein [Profundirhabdus halotolerans]